MVPNKVGTTPTWRTHVSTVPVQVNSFSVLHVNRIYFGLIEGHGSILLIFDSFTPDSNCVRRAAHLRLTY